MKKNIIIAIFLFFATTVCGCSTSSSGSSVGYTTDRSDITTDGSGSNSESISNVPGVVTRDFIVSIKDKENRPFEFVKVVLNENAKSGSYTETADVDGNAIFRDIPLGNYTVSFPGFSDETAAITVEQKTPSYEFSVEAAKIGKASFVIADENGVEINPSSNRVMLIPNGRFADTSDFFKDAVELTYNAGTKTWNTINIDLYSGVYVIYIENLNTGEITGAIDMVAAGAGAGTLPKTIQTREPARIGDIDLFDENGQSYGGDVEVNFFNQNTGGVFSGSGPFMLFEGDECEISVPEYSYDKKRVRLDKCVNNIRQILHRARVMVNVEIMVIKNVYSPGVYENFPWLDDQSRIKYSLGLRSSYDGNPLGVELTHIGGDFWGTSSSVSTGNANVKLLKHIYDDTGLEIDVSPANSSNTVDIKTTTRSPLKIYIVEYN